MSVLGSAEAILRVFFRRSMARAVEPQHMMPQRFIVRADDLGDLRQRLRESARRVDARVWVREGDGDSVRRAPAELALDGFNVFLLGSSAMRGMGLTWDESFGQRLRSHFPDVPGLNVYNCAVNAHTSKDMARTAFTILERYRPDLLIIYSGNNEFIHWYYPLVTRVAGIDLSSVSYAMTHLYLYRLLLFGHRMWRSEFLENSPVHDPERLTDYARCLDERFTDYARYDPTRYADDQRAILGAYEANLRAVVREAAAREVRVVITSLPIRLKLSPCFCLRQPLAIRSGGALDAEIADRLRATARAARAGSSATAMDDLRNLVAKEPESPLPRYFLAKALETRGEVEAARDAYAEARERMYGYLGCILSLNAIAERVAREEGAAFADIRSRIEREGRGADPYLDRLIYDYCHLNAAGMAIAVDEVARAIRDANLLPAGADRVETRRSGR